MSQVRRTLLGRLFGMRKIHLILTIGGGFAGLAGTLPVLFAAKDANPIFYALNAAFMALYGYGLFAGLRLADRPEDKKHLLIFYWLQVPWISSSLITFRFASGLDLSGGLIGFQLKGVFYLGSNWQFSLLQIDAPWGIGVNALALLMVILLRRERRKAQEPTPVAVTLPVTSESGGQ